jgi:4-hydroxy-3-methylbut-2-enyl diphosphate reductase
LGLTAAASTPEIVVTEILDALGARFEVTARDAEAMRETAAFKPVRVA